MPNTRARIATICQSGAHYPTIEQNRNEVLRRVEIALKHKPDLVCLPEAFINPGVEGEIADLAERIPGPTSQIVSKLAEQNRCYIICPLWNSRDSKYRNSAILFDRKGDILGIYDKMHPVTTSPDYTQVENGITPGDSVPVFDLDFGRIGIQICFDIQFSEGWAAIAEQGAKAIIWASAYNGGFPLQAYAWLHHTYIISAVNTEKARIIDPCGTILAETDYQTNVLVRDINLDYAVCHYDFNYDIPDRIQNAHAGKVEIRPHWDAGHFLVEPIDPELTIAQLKEEFGFLTTQEYNHHHDIAYTALRTGNTPPVQQTAHGNRPMYQKENT